MTKLFCDKCGNQITKKFEAVTFKVVHTEFTIRESGLGQEDSDICGNCVLDAIALMDPRLIPSVPRT